MNWFDGILYPLKWVVAWIMVGAHNVLTFLGLPGDSGASWVLSIVALVIVIRVLLIPLFVRQIKASRGMQLVQPEIQKLQKKYKGKTDPASRQAMQQEMMQIYKDHGTSPFASCLPLLAQMPIFFALFRVLYSLKDLSLGNYSRDAIGPIDKVLALQIEESTIFGARLSDTFLNSDAMSVKIICAVLVVLMSASTLFTQRQLTMKNMPQSALDNPMARQQRVLMYIFPLVFAFSGVNFPIGVLIYWTTSNIWTLGQQWWVIHNNPTPGSEAARLYEERKARKAARKAARRGDAGALEDGAGGVSTALEDEPEKPVSGQRQQPKKGTPRSKRRPGGQSAANPVPAYGTAPESDDAPDEAPTDAPTEGNPLEDGPQDAPATGKKKPKKPKK